MLVIDIFALNDRQELIVHLESFEWDFEQYGAVMLQIGNQKIDCTYIGSGNLKGIPIVKLKVNSANFHPVDVVVDLFNKHNGSAFLQHQKC